MVAGTPELTELIVILILRSDSSDIKEEDSVAEEVIINN